jgi:hypothetical protein
MCAPLPIHALAAADSAFEAKVLQLALQQQLPQCLSKRHPKELKCMFMLLFKVTGKFNFAGIRVC